MKQILTINLKYFIIKKINADIAQLVEQCIRNTWVAGSNPVISSILTDNIIKTITKSYFIIIIMMSSFFYLNTCS